MAGGTVEACRMTVFRSAAEDHERRSSDVRREIDEATGVPVPAYRDVEKRLPVSEENVLSVLAEDYRVNPGLHMTVGDLRQYIEGDEDEVLRTAERLEEQGSVMALRDRKNGGIRL